MKNTGTHGAVLRTYLKGIVKSFFPKRRYGFVEESKTGTLVYFNMNQCFKFECLTDEGPAFCNEQKNDWPQKGDVILFILDTHPTQPGMRPSASHWNFADSFKKCLEAYSKTKSEAEKPVTPPQQKAPSKQGQHLNSPRRTSHHTEDDVEYLPEWARDPKMPAPNINLAAEFKIGDQSLEQLARSVGGKNGGTRKIHQAARNHRVTQPMN